jgi:Nucleotidyltransferase of unknown function (DUF6036)
MPREVPRSQTNVEPGYPWGPFLREIDEQSTQSIPLQCLGGFVVTQHYGLGRETSDIDCIAVVGSKPIDFAGVGSDLHKKYRVYLQYVTVATPPSDYEGRLQRMFPKAPWKHLKLFALDATDLALSKLERNFDRDREDFQFLFRAGLIDLTVLERRYREEVRPYLLSKLDWHDKTLNLWLGIAKSIQG